MYNIYIKYTGGHIFFFCNWTGGHILKFSMVYTLFFFIKKTKESVVSYKKKKYVHNFVKNWNAKKNK